MAEKPDDPFDQMEPACQGLTLGHPSIEVAAAVSSAISLKRIADALEKIAPGGKLSPNFFSDAAFFGGRAFEEGRER